MYRRRRNWKEGNNCESAENNPNLILVKPIIITGESHCYKALSKMYTGVLARRLNGWIEKRGAISECQMGFRKGR
jgi:hypothetical protein